MPAPPIRGAFHRRILDSIWRMVAESRLPQTMLFGGPEGVGKATVARHMAAGLHCEHGPGPPCGDCQNCQSILGVDLSTDHYRKMLADRRKMPKQKRDAAPLIIAAHPDVLTFVPDGPLQTIGIEQALKLREQSRFPPSSGPRRVFILDQSDHANLEAANALLKTLEEPAPSLTIVLTASNPFLLPATIRSRAVPFHFPSLTRSEMSEFLARRNDVPAAQQEQLARWSMGSPGVALTLDVDEYLARRQAMVALLRTALEPGHFGPFVAQLGRIASKRSEGIPQLATMLASLLRDLLRLHLGVEEGIVHCDIRSELAPMSKASNVPWINRAIDALDDLELMGRRNLQKQMALEGMALSLQP